LGLTAQGYGQAGWVGGLYATAFADGQARVTREIAGAGPARLHIGAGAWGGAQKFAERLDVGPTIGVDVDAGPVVARLAVDYRIQVAGSAAPGDGVALTLSTGF
jgi:urocanate hydratase